MELLGQVYAKVSELKEEFEVYLSKCMLREM
jgi:hypothetical protein